MTKKSTSNHSYIWLGFGLSLGMMSAAWLRAQNKRKAAAWNRHMHHVSQRCALITGASSGIGRAYALRLAEEGFNLVLVARREQRLEQLAMECNQKFGVLCEILPADLSTQSGVERVEQRIQRGNDIDYLVNAAGYSVFGDFISLPAREHLEMIECMTLASVRFCRAALPGMLSRDRGVIINVSSIGAFNPKPKDVTYCASKAFLYTFSEGLQKELAKTNIRVQALCPGFTRTEFFDQPLLTPYEMQKSIPSWLWKQPEEVVEASYQALAKKKVLCAPGWQNQLICSAGRLGLTTHLLKMVGGFIPPAMVEPLPEVSLTSSEPQAPQTEPVLLKNPIAETLLIPLYYRSIESRHEHPLVRDEHAGRILTRLEVDLSRLGKISFSQTTAMIRAREFDHLTRHFLEQNPQGTIVEIGCGLDTRYYRVDNGRAQWLELDIAEAMELRQRLLPSPQRCKRIATSVFDTTWMEQLAQDLANRPSSKVLFIAEGVFPYFSEAQMRLLMEDLSQRFAGSEMLLDTLSSWIVRFGAFHPSLRGFQARPRWPVDSIQQVEALCPGVKVLSSWGYFDTPEPRLEAYQWMASIPSLRSVARILHIQLGEK